MGPTGPTGAAGAAGEEGPTGDTGPTGAAAITGYGGLYNNSTQNITIPANGQQQVSLDEDMPFSGMTLGANSITITTAGDYMVDAMLAGQSTTGSFGFSFGVAVNGSLTGTSLTTSRPMVEDFDEYTIGAIVTLAAGDVLTLVVDSVTGGTIALGADTNAFLRVVLVGSD